MSDTERDNSGKFTEKVTEQDILKVFDASEDPFLTAKEIAASLPISQSAVNYRLDKMHEKGLVDRKETGARGVGWWAVVAPRLSEKAREQADNADTENTVSQDEMKRRLGIDG